MLENLLLKLFQWEFTFTKKKQSLKLKHTKRIKNNANFSIIFRLICIKISIKLMLLIFTVTYILIIVFHHVLLVGKCNDKLFQWCNSKKISCATSKVEVENFGLIILGWDFGEFQQTKGDCRERFKIVIWEPRIQMLACS